jgi:hypothetical protein
MEAESIKLPQLTKGLRYYYKHRDELSAARRERLIQDPEYQAKQAAKEEAKRVKEEAKKAKEEAKERAKEEKEKAKKEEAQRIKDEKRKIKEQLLGIRPV